MSDAQALELGGLSKKACKAAAAGPKRGAAAVVHSWIWRFR